MNSPGTVRIRLNDIDVGKRLRDVDPDYGTWIAASLKAEGQLQPIEVRPVGPANPQRYKLTVGAHRVYGARLNGWPDIEAKIVKVSDLQAELREIVENLVRHELNPFDRATALARMQLVYLELHPKTAKGKAGAEARWHTNDELSFAAATAEKLRVSKRDIERSIRRHDKIAPDVREKIKGTWIGRNGVQLDALTRLGPDEQRKVVKLMLQEAHPAPNVAAAMRAIYSELKPAPDVDSEQYKKLLGAWRKAGAKARREFVDYLRNEGALDAPKVAA